MDSQSITHQDDLATDEDQIRAVLAGEIDSYQREKRYIHKDGHLLWVQLSVSLVRSTGDEPLYIIKQVQDITARIRAEHELAALNIELEARVRERTEALEEANGELESFCYSVSHDLRAPLRHINGYATLLSDECEGRLSDQAATHLYAISGATRQMGRLIDDLLGFSRTGRAERTEAVLDLNALVSETMTGLGISTTGRHIDWTIEALPPVIGDHAMIRQVFANLLGNAVKYTQRRAHAHIEIRAVGMEDDRVVLMVRDDGVGFDMKYADKLFSVFHRLHRADEFEGTGVGLASVRRILARHGGRVWAEASPERAASFYFTMLAADPLACEEWCSCR